MAGTFISTVTELCSVLGLAPPAFGQDQEMTLTIDGLPLRLTDTPDERHLLLTAVAGELAEDPLAAASQVRNLLQKSLGYIGISRACISLIE